MSLQPSSAAVVGGGIGGLAAALALLRAGWDVRVYEQAGLRSEVGAGIQLAPNCTRILRGLGVLPAVERVAVRPTTFEFRRWDDGRLLSSTPLGDAIERTYGAPYLHAHRADLVAVLAAAVPADRVEVGAAVRRRGAPRRARRSVSPTARRTAADLVVGADGIHSAVRQALFGDERPRFTGHVAYRGLIPAERVADLALEPPLHGPAGAGRAPRALLRRPPGGCLNVVCVVGGGRVDARVVDRPRRRGRAPGRLRRLAPGRPGDHRRAGRAAEVGAVRPRPVPAVEPGRR